MWSPTTSHPRLFSVIAAVTPSAVENEETDDPDVAAAVLAALKRHVHLTVVLTNEPRWGVGADAAAGGAGEWFCTAAGPTAGSCL